jgi:hypothetical protein
MYCELYNTMCILRETSITDEFSKLKLPLLIKRNLIIKGVT